MTRRVAIMQPTFLPWLGYFALLDAVDEFVYLDDVQLVRRSWHVRNRIRTGGGTAMVSLNVVGKPSRPTIAEARLARTGFEKALARTISSALAKAPYRAMVESLIDEAFTAAGDSLVALNIGLVEGVARRVGIGGRRRRSSELGIPAMDKSDRLYAICRTLGAEEYLSPVGSAAYLAESDPFAASSIALRFLNYEPRPYPQAPGTPFESHLAAIDALAWLGPDEFLPLVRSGIGRSMTLDEVTRPRESAA